MSSPDRPANRADNEQTSPIDERMETLEVEAEAERRPEQRAERVFVGTGLFWGLLVGVIVAVAFIILAAQNTLETSVRFLSWRISTPLIALILVSFLAGVVLDELVGLVYRARRRRVLQEREELRALRERSR